MKRSVKLIAFALGVLLLVPLANAQTTTFEATFSGGEEVPAVQSSARGSATFTLSPDGKSLSYTLSVTGIDNPTMAHIHLAVAGKSGPPVVDLYPTQTYAIKAGMVSGTLAEGTITAANLMGSLKGKTVADLVAQIRAGNAYVNVHTKAHPVGEIRGQIQ